MADNNSPPTWRLYNNAKDTGPSELRFLGRFPRSTGETSDDANDRAPSFTGTYVDPTDPQSTGQPPAFTSLYMPEFYRGLIEAGTALIDLPTMAAGYSLGTGAELLGWDDTAKALKNPVLLGDIVKGGFEAPAVIEEAITGESPTVTAGFDATPRTARNAQERFWRDVFYISGGGISFPTAIAQAFGTLRGPVQKLLLDAGGRGETSEAARSLLARAQNKKGPNAVQALSDAAAEYAQKFAKGLGGQTKRTLLLEQGLATAAGFGFAAPERYTDENGRIMMDIGEGEVDVAPTLKILSSMGLPIAVAHTPSGIAIAGDKTKVVPLIKWVQDKTRVFAKSLVGGFSDQGRYDLASRIFNSLESEAGVLEKILLPAIESGQFVTPGSSTPIRILEDGTVVPEYGGVRPDTLQALKELGATEPRLAALDAALRGRGTNAAARLVEEQRRAERLDETFELLRTTLGSGDEAVAYKAMETARNNLDKEALDSLESALNKARNVFKALEPSLGRDEASKLAVEMLEEARLASREVRKRLWAKELVGTEYVDTQKFGDWAIQVIKETDRNARITPGMAIFYKLAGKKRLAEELGIGESGRPLTIDDLQGVKGDAGDLLDPVEIPQRGLYDLFGEPGTLYAEPVKIEVLDKLRSEFGDKVRKAYRAGDAKLGERLGRVISYIDDDLLAAKNFEQSDLPLFKNLLPENIRNIKFNREYTKNAKARFGPNSEIGRILYVGNKPIPEGFLNSFLRTGPEAGARVELFRDALNEPIPVIQDGNATWKRNPEATLTLGDNPNVIEADLLLRYTEGLANGQVTQRGIDRFLTQYKGAVDKIPGLRKRFNDLGEVQKAVDEISYRLTVPSREKVLAALQSGATVEDVLNAKMMNYERLTDRRLANTASEYLRADPEKAARSFMDTSPELAAKRADEIAILLAKDETGAAEAGFRAALWRVLRDGSRRAEGPGIDTQKYNELVNNNRDYLSKFFDKNSMEFLTELGRGAQLQRTGTSISPSGNVADVMGAEFGTLETVGALGRTGGQWAFGKLGINPLVATGMGRRIAAYTFTKMGEDQIMKHVEDALRDPVKAAALIKRYKELDMWEPSAMQKQLAERALENPVGLGTEAAITAKDRLSRGASAVSNILKGHSKEAIERAVRFGLVPAQAESRRMTLEEDYKLGRPSGGPFIYEDNRIRYAIENNPEYTEAPPPPAPPQRPAKAPVNYPPGRGPIPASGLSQIRPVPARSPGPASPSTVSRMNELGIPLFSFQGFNHGGYADKKSGIMSLKCKPQQIVG